MIGSHVERARESSLALSCLFDFNRKFKFTLDKGKRQV